MCVLVFNGRRLRINHKSYTYNIMARTTKECTEHVREMYVIQMHIKTILLVQLLRIWRSELCLHIEAPLH